MASYLYWGAILGVAHAALSLLMFFLGFQNDNIAQGEKVQWLGFIFIIVILIFALRSVGAERGPKGFGYGAGLGASTAIGLFGGLFAGLYSVLHTLVINPAMKDDIIAYQLEKLEAQGVPSEGLKQAEGWMAFSLSPAGQLIFSIVGTVFICFLLGLILAAIFRRAPTAQPSAA